MLAEFIKDYLSYRLFSWVVIPIPINSILALFSGSGCGCLIIAVVVILFLPIYLIYLAFTWPPFWIFLIGFYVIVVVIECFKKYTIVSSIVTALLLAALIYVLNNKCDFQFIYNSIPLIDDAICDSYEIRKNESKYLGDSTNNSKVVLSNIGAGFDTVSRNTVENKNNITTESVGKIYSVDNQAIIDTKPQPIRKTNKYPARVYFSGDSNFLLKKLITPHIFIVGKSDYPYIYILNKNEGNNVVINIMYDDGENVTTIGVYNWNGKENDYEANKFKKYMYSDIIEESALKLPQ